MVAGVVFILMCLVMEIVRIRDNKERLFSCLTPLPKTNVSQMTENLRVRKRENEEPSTATNNDTSKQDDNVMKIFVAGGSSGFTALVDQLVNLLLTKFVSAPTPSAPLPDSQICSYPSRAHQLLRQSHEGFKKC
jgi:hypothetical protein